MRLTKIAIAALAASIAAGPVLADLVFPALSYRTGPYAPNGIPFADGYADYFTLLNERDGGIGGVPTKLLECETGYNTEKVLNATSPPKGRARWSINRSPLGSHTNLFPKRRRTAFRSTLWGTAGPLQRMVRSSAISLTTLRITGMVRQSRSTISSI